MKSRAINPLDHSYAHAVEVTDARRWLFVSGQVPEDDHNQVPEDFRAQARLVWANIQTQLSAADMGPNNIVKITTYLSDRKYRQENFEVRHEAMAGRNVAVTIIIADIYDEAWLLEIEVTAAG